MSEDEENELFYHLYFELDVRPGDERVPNGLDDAFSDWIEAEKDAWR